MSKNAKKYSLFVILSILFVVFLIAYIRLPDYDEYSSFKFSSKNFCDTTLEVVVYKSHFDKDLYKEIEEHHNRINGTPTILTLKLYFSKYDIEKGKEPYRVVVFDYDNHLTYIKLKY